MAFCVDFVYNDIKHKITMFLFLKALPPPPPPKPLAKVGGAFTGK